MADKFLDHPLSRTKDRSGLHFYDDHLYLIHVGTSDVYDGDTIENVAVRIADLPETGVTRGSIRTIWPQVELMYNAIVVKFNLRVNGIDTPEVHPSKHWADGSVRTQESREHEHLLAMHARDELIHLLEKHDNIAYIRNPQIGKYAGRLVAELVFKEKDGTIFDYAQYMISEGLAHPYGGGTKPPWHLDEELISNEPSKSQ